MKNMNRRIPEGTRDILFSDLEAKRSLENKLADFFKNRGFSEIATPTIEYYDVFCGNCSPLPQESMYKLCDNSGRLLVLRADSTVPAARIAATKLQSPIFPLRFYYNQNAFAISPSERGNLNEITQSGIEIIGALGIKSDIECLALAAKALSACFDGIFKIEIGHVGFFKTLVRTVTQNEDVIEDIRTFIEQKNFSALYDILNEISMQNKNNEEINKGCDALRRLPRLFGDKSVLNEAETLVDDGKDNEEINYLRTIYDKLSALGLADIFTFDLGLVHRVDYYTGIVFRAYIPSAGSEILSGGRYDSLLESFGSKPLAAIGFAIDTDAICEILVKDSEPDICPPDYLIFYENGNEAKAYIEADKLIARGKTVEMAVFETIFEAEEYAKQKGIKKVTVI